MSQKFTFTIQNSATIYTTHQITNQNGSSWLYRRRARAAGKVRMGSLKITSIFQIPGRHTSKWAQVVRKCTAASSEYLTSVPCMQRQTLRTRPPCTQLLWMCYCCNNILRRVGINSLKFVHRVLHTMCMLLLAWASIFTLRIGQFVDCKSSVASSGRGPGLLYPHESESRQIQLLDGMWNFRADRSDCRCEGLMQQWYLKPLSEVLLVPELYQTVRYLNIEDGDQTRKYKTTIYKMRGTWFRKVTRLKSMYTLTSRLNKPLRHRFTTKLSWHYPTLASVVGSHFYDL